MNRYTISFKDNTIEPDANGKWVKHADVIDVEAGATPASPTIGPDQAGGSYIGPDGQRQYINPDQNSGFPGGPPLTSSTPQTVQEFASQLDPEHQAAVYKAAGQVLGSTGNLALASQIHGIAAGTPPPIPAGPINLDAAQQAEDAARDRYEQAATLFPGDKRVAPLLQAYTKANQDRVRAEADDMKHQGYIQKQADRLGFDDLDTTKSTAEQQQQLEDFRAKILPQRQAKLDESFQGVQAAQTKWQTAQDHEASLADKYAQELSDAQAKARATATKNLTIDPANPPDDSAIETAADKIFAGKQKLIDQTYALRISEAQKQAKALETAAQSAATAHARLQAGREYQNLQPSSLQSSGPVQITSLEQKNALAPGTQYIGPDGRVAIHQGPAVQSPTQPPIESTIGGATSTPLTRYDPLSSPSVMPPRSVPRIGPTAADYLGNP
jgi:hypothetical protein